MPELQQSLLVNQGANSTTRTGNVGGINKTKKVALCLYYDIWHESDCPGVILYEPLTSNSTYACIMSALVPYRVFLLSCYIGLFCRP